MIRYDITLAELRRRIEEQRLGWLDRAAQRTAQFQATREYSETSSIWGEIKAVYMTLQYNKCAYCERCLSDGSIEHDLEHYRPKRGVEPWSAPPRKPAYGFATGDALPEGYYLLAYHPLNYSTACKRCNTNFKRNYFPIGGKRLQGLPGPHNYKGELPFIPYPISSFDENPEDLIVFDGITPIPNPAATEAQQRRAQVTIDFFGLDVREDLRRERSEVIRTLHFVNMVLERGFEHDRQLAQDTIDSCISPSERHTNCARCFYRLQQTNPTRALGVAGAAIAFLKDIGA